jgi:asparagine synthase (glutamine-hydrolysing)
MCGISGIVNKTGVPVERNEIKEINDVIYHRGPDAEGFYFHSCFAFGHRRLSVIDISSAGHQPMEYLNKYWITYNGEVYNYIEIRDELIRLGYTFRTATDTEVILAAYDKWGVECFVRFNGMWAMAIFDKSSNIIVFSRDRFGIKPLYYKDLEASFIFGSEIKQLINCSTENKINEDVLLEYMLTRIDNHTEATYFKNINSLPPSHYMIYSLADHSYLKTKYYELKTIPGIDCINETQLIESFKDTFKSAVKLRLRSDVKVGTCLSGGLDSSAISNLAAGMYNVESDARFTAINVKSTDKVNDESQFASIVAKSSNIELHTVMPTYEDFINSIDEVIYTQEEPFGSPSMFMGWHVFQKARALDCKVMLNGQGGDEILLGYERYFPSTISLLNPFNFFYSIYNQSANSRQSFFTLFAFYFYFKIPFLRALKNKRRSLVKKDFKRNKYFDFIKMSARSYKSPSQLQILEITTLQLPHLLRYEDRNSMRHSIETRLPFLDYRLVELAISLPLIMKINKGWTKYILRRSIDGDLPEEIVWRKNKFGFESPENWITEYSPRMLIEIQSSKLLKHFCDMRKLEKKYHNLSDWDKWMYFNIARWEKVFNVTL